MSLSSLSLPFLWLLTHLHRARSHLQQSILDNNLLEGVRRWLEPLPDKSLPNGIIQKALIPKLVDMDIDSITLKMSGLGKIMLFYSRCARVDLALRRTADKLIGEDASRRPFPTLASLY